jgi:hypothetical protein
MKIQCQQQEKNLDLFFKNLRLSPNLDFPQFSTTRLGNTCSSLLLPKSPGHEDQPYDRSDQYPPAGMQGQPCPMQNSCCISRALLQALMALRSCWNHVRTATQNVILQDFKGYNRDRQIMLPFTTGPNSLSV